MKKKPASNSKKENSQKSANSANKNYNRKMAMKMATKGK